MSTQPDANNLWQLSVTLPLPDAQKLELLFEDHALTASFTEAVADGSLWQLDILFAEEPEDWVVSQIPADLEFSLAPLVQKDWVSESQKLLRPVKAGRFYIHGSHDPKHKSIAMHDLTIDAGRAFGTGLHETTYGCLNALHDLRKSTDAQNILDLGCGSGVLALAAAKAWGRPVTASDIDPDAVEVTLENAWKNGIGPMVRAIEATGLNDRTLKSKGPYDLLIANILAWPLVSLAPSISGALARNGTLVLSGLLGKQENMVRNAYRLHGLSLRKRYVFGEWHTLVLGR